MIGKSRLKNEKRLLKTHTWGFQAKCVFQSSKISEPCKACQPFMLIDKVFGEWTCRICGRQEYGEKRMKKHVSDKHETPLHTCKETSQDSTDTYDDNNNESKLSKLKVETMINETVDNNNDTESSGAIDLVHDQDLITSVQDDKNDGTKIYEPEVEPTMMESVDKSFFHPSNISADSCMACQPYILIDKVFGETTCRICARQEYGEKRMKSHIEKKHKTLLHVCGKLQGI